MKKIISEILIVLLYAGSVHSGTIVLQRADGNICEVKLKEIKRSSYVREGSIGKVREKPKKSIRRDDFSFGPIDSWKGERFVFLPAVKKLIYEYRSLYISNEVTRHPNYKSYVGRIAIVTDVRRNLAHGGWIVAFEMEDTYEFLRADVGHSNIIEGIAPVADIDRARERWLGKTLWCKRRFEEFRTYDAEKREFGFIKVEESSPIEVIDIVAGWFNDWPVRFICRTPSGEIGYTDLNLSGTNVQESSRNFCRFSDYFLEFDRFIEKVLQDYNDKHCFGDRKRGFGSFSDCYLIMHNISQISNIKVDEDGETESGKMAEAVFHTAQMAEGIKKQIFRDLSVALEVKIIREEKYLALGFITEETVNTEGTTEEQRKVKVGADSWNEMSKVLQSILPGLEGHFQGVIIRIGYLEANLEAFKKGISPCTYKMMEGKECSLDVLKKVLSEGAKAVSETGGRIQN